MKKGRRRRSARGKQEKGVSEEEKEVQEVGLSGSVRSKKWRRAPGERDDEVIRQCAR